MGGIWGTLSAGLFTTPELAAIGRPGLFYGGGLYQLGVQALGILAAGSFVFLSSLAVFAILKATIGIRVKPDQELDGLDIHEHGVYGYPDLVATDYPNGNGSKIPDSLERTAEGTT
jgi:Amt family ammonium transporter